jgi:formate dehydrogenase iron-sulfur subunit
MKLSRRTFFKVNAAGVAALTVGATATSAEAASGSRERVGVLVDTTRCIGCRGCEAACAEANALATPDEGDVFASRRATTTAHYTVVNRLARPAPAEARFVKSQCMHCVEPACASACLVRALEKTPEGPVVYHAERCLGCRYCMVACPFGTPKFEYEKAVPLVRKCTFCLERQARGLEPACTSVCPSGALTFGRRDALLEEARTRIYQHPDRYVHHIYGEHEVGGTSWLYISDVPFEEAGFRTDLGTAPAAGYAQDALAGVPVVMTVGPAVLMGLYSIARRRQEIQAQHGSTLEGDRHE